MYWGYTMSQWQCESLVNRARCVAHMVHFKMREGYESEKAAAKGKKKGDKATLSGLMSALGM